MLFQRLGQLLSSDHPQNLSHFPAANTAAVVTLISLDRNRRIIHSVQWSYSDNPTGGRLTITDDGVTIFDVDITVGGPGGFTITKVGGRGKTMVVTLAAGGAGIVGKLNVDTNLIG